MTLPNATATAVPVAAQQPGHNPGDCGKVAPILARIGDKWTVLVVMVLAAGPLRFNELRRQVGMKISQRMLTFTVRGLERDGLLSRRELGNGKVPAVEYALTALGHSLLATLKPLGAWAKAQADEVAAAQAKYDGRG